MVYKVLVELYKCNTSNPIRKWSAPCLSSGSHAVPEMELEEGGGCRDARQKEL